jgi:hypothetical protein
MAAMTTALTEFADNGNSRTYIRANHSAMKPALLTQSRKLPSGSIPVAHTTFKVVQATEDALGNVLVPKVVFSAEVSIPVNGTDTDVAAALAAFRDMIAGDEFGASILSQGWLK